MWCCADGNSIAPEQAFVTINIPPPAHTLPADSILARIIARVFHRCEDHGPISETRSSQLPPLEGEMVEQADEAVERISPLERSLSQMEVSSFESLRSDHSFWSYGEERAPVEGGEKEEDEETREASDADAHHQTDVDKEELVVQKEGESATYSTASTEIVKD